MKKGEQRCATGTGESSTGRFERKERTHAQLALVSAGRWPEGRCSPSGPPARYRGDDSGITIGRGWTRAAPPGPKIAAWASGPGVPLSPDAPVRGVRPAGSNVGRVWVRAHPRLPAATPACADRSRGRDERHPCTNCGLRHARGANIEGRNTPWANCDLRHANRNYALKCPLHSVDESWGVRARTSL